MEKRSKQSEHKIYFGPARNVAECNSKACLENSEINASLLAECSFKEHYTDHCINTSFNGNYNIFRCWANKSVSIRTTGLEQAMIQVFFVISRHNNIMFQITMDIRLTRPN